MAVGTAALARGGLMRRRHRALHARIWRVLAVLLPALLLLAVLVRPDRQPADPPVRLAPP